MASSYREEEEEDRISRLPKDLIESILERVPIRDAIRTSALARNWRYNWVSMKTMKFDKDFSHCLIMRTKFSEYDKVVHDIMMQHDGSIESFSIETPYSIRSQFLTKALLVASTKGVKFLAIDLYELVTPLYSFSHITQLKINGIQFDEPPPRTLCFPNLVTLSCDSVNFFHDSFEIFMSGCPILERLNMHDCGPLGDSGPGKFEIFSASLKHLEVYAESEPVFVIDTKNLETLTARPPRLTSPGFGTSPFTIVAPLSSLKKLYFNCSSVNVDDGPSYIISIIQNLPNLVELKIRTSLLRGAKDMEQVIKSSYNGRKATLPQLLLVKFTSVCWGIKQPELSVLRFLLAQSPCLKRMVISVYELCDSGKSKFPSELMEYHRASPEVQIVFSGK